MVILSICIATRNRSKYLIETIKCIEEQLDDKIEIVVVDGASTDNSKEHVEDLNIPSNKLRYFFENENSGVDGDFDKAVQYAKGNYCWLFSDDDLMYPGALERVCQAIGSKQDVYVINSAIYSKHLDRQLTDRSLNIMHDKVFGSDVDCGFVDLGAYLSFIGSVVIRRDFWISRERLRYHGSFFAHLGVIFQSPLPKAIEFISEPLIKIRYGNSEWAPQGFVIWTKHWPNIVHELDHFSLTSRNLISGAGAIKTIRFCLLYRALGLYGRDQYYSSMRESYSLFVDYFLWMIAWLPEKLVNSLYTLSVLGRRTSLVNVYRLANSPAASPSTRLIAYLLDLND